MMIPRPFLIVAWALCLLGIAVRPANAQDVLADGRQVTLSQALPTGEIATSQVLLQSISPVNVVPGVPYVQTLKITNLTDCALADVTLYQVLNPQLTLVRSLPKPTGQDQLEVTWQLGKIPPHGATTVEASVVAAEEGQFEQCLSLTWVPAACVGVKVIAPLLTVQQVMPRAVLGCDEMSVRLVVTNPGSASLSDVKVTSILPAGLLTAEGEQMYRFILASLGPGEAVERAFTMSAVQTGTYHIRTVAEAAGGLTREASGDIMIRQPALALSVKSMDRQFTGRDITYEYTVTNVGDATADGIVVRSSLPQNAEYAGAGEGGNMRDDKMIYWQIPPLAAGERRMVHLTVRAMASGLAKLDAEATASCAAPVQAMGATQVFGIAAVLLEVTDLQDPIEVGNEGTYLIKVTNQGNKADTNVLIVCELENSQQFIAADGPTQAVAQGNRIQFAALKTLEPGQEVVWRVRVRAAQAGDIRFRAQLTSDQLKRPVHETESTSQY